MERNIVGQNIMEAYCHPTYYEVIEYTIFR
jgi:hypothetical protein